MQNHMILTILYATIRDTTVADAAERAQEDTNHDYNNRDSYPHGANADLARIAEDHRALKNSPMSGLEQPIVGASPGPCLSGPLNHLNLHKFRRCDTMPS